MPIAKIGSGLILHGGYALFGSANIKTDDILEHCGAWEVTAASAKVEVLHLSREENANRLPYNAVEHLRETYRAMSALYMKRLQTIHLFHRSNMGSLCTLSGFNPVTGISNALPNSAVEAPSEAGASAGDSASEVDGTESIGGGSSLMDSTASNFNQSRRGSAASTRWVLNKLPPVTPNNTSGGLMSSKPGSAASQQRKMSTSTSSGFFHGSDVAGLDFLSKVQRQPAARRALAAFAHGLPPKGGYQAGVGTSLTQSSSVGQFLGKNEAKGPLLRRNTMLPRINPAWVRGGSLKSIERRYTVLAACNSSGTTPLK